MVSSVVFSCLFIYLFFFRFIFYLFPLYYLLPATTVRHTKHTIQPPTILTTQIHSGLYITNSNVARWKIPKSARWKKKYYPPHYQPPSSNDACRLSFFSKILFCSCVYGQSQSWNPNYCLSLHISQLESSSYLDVFLFLFENLFCGSVL